MMWFGRGFNHQVWENKNKNKNKSGFQCVATSFAKMICSNFGHDTSAKLSSMKKKFKENQKNEKNPEKSEHGFWV